MDPVTRLALAARDGERPALVELVRRTQADVWRFCAATSGRLAADDLTQETYARALVSLARFRGDASARTWLLAIARNVAADAVRREVRSKAREDRAAQLRRAHHDGHGDAVVLGALVDRLTDDRREAFVLTQVIGLGYAEAAEVVGCPIGTIRSRVARAREDLVAAVRADNDHEDEVAT